MPATRRSLSPLLLLAAAAGLSAVAARSELIGLPTEYGSGVDVDVEGWAGTTSAVSGRDAGMVPLVVSITNETSAELVYTVGPGWRSSAATPMVRIPVPAKGTVRATVYVDPGDSRSFGSAEVRITGHGLSGGEYSLSLHTFMPPGTPLPVAVSRGVVAAQGEAFAAYQIHGNGLDMKRPPEDWRGWSTFRDVLLTESEWLEMPAGSRAALLDWLSLGGRAGVLVEDASAARLDRLRFPAADGDGRRRVGAGEIVAVSWDGAAVEEADAAAFIGPRKPGALADRLTGYRPQGKGWDSGFGRLVAIFGPRLLPVSAILCFLAAFGLLAGPVNLMVFAGPGRRSRMFWTTPALSLAATLFLLALMVLGDGVGGVGARRMLCLLVPETNRMAVVQEQFSRTGVLLGSSFPVREPSWMRQVGGTDATRGNFVEVEGRLRRGDWFRSRTDQAHLIETVRPSRARIEFVADPAGPPALISSIEVPLERVFVIDEAGGYWTAQQAGTGERVRLAPSDANAYARWFDELAADAGPVRRAALEEVRNRRGVAYAESRTAAQVAVQTLGSIRWADERAIFVAPVTRTTP